MDRKLLHNSGQLGLIFLFSMGCSAPLSPPLNGDSDLGYEKSNPTEMPESSTIQSDNVNVIATGDFMNGEHPTSGQIQVLKQGENRTLDFKSNFKTSTSGPDLVVVLHRSTDVIGSTVPPAYPLKSGDYIILASLKRYSGEQSYVIPSDISLSNYPSVAVWCRKFNATFGAAHLK